MRRIRQCTLLAVALALVAAACAGPSRTDDDYAKKATATADDARSAVQTARLLVRAADDERGFAPYVSVSLSDAERDASAVVDTFSSIQPPTKQADRVRDELLALLERATDVLADLRIAVRRGELASLADHAPELDAVARALDDFSERVG